MDNTDNKAGVSEQAVPSSQQVTQSSPVGLVQKEQEPTSQGVAPSEVITSSEAKPRLDREVGEAGVEQVLDRVPLTEEHKAVGIQHAPESTPVPTQPSGFAIDEVRKDLQISPIYSGRWLAELRRRVLKMFGLWKEGK